MIVTLSSLQTSGKSKVPGRLTELADPKPLLASVVEPVVSPVVVPVQWSAPQQPSQVAPPVVVAPVVAPVVGTLPRSQRRGEAP
jgi:hypothetical protein